MESLQLRQTPEHDPVIARLAGIHRDVRGQTVRMSADPAKVHVLADGKSLFHA